MTGSQTSDDTSVLTLDSRVQAQMQSLENTTIDNKDRVNVGS